MSLQLNCSVCRKPVPLAGRKAGDRLPCPHCAAPLHLAATSQGPQLLADRAPGGTAAVSPGTGGIPASAARPAAPAPVRPSHPAVAQPAAAKRAATPPAVVQPAAARPAPVIAPATAPSASPTLTTTTVQGATVAFPAPSAAPVRKARGWLLAVAGVSLFATGVAVGTTVALKYARSDAKVASADGTNTADAAAGTTPPRGPDAAAPPVPGPSGTSGGATPPGGADTVATTSPKPDSGPAKPVAATVEEIVARSEPSVCIIRTPYGAGTGFVVGDQTVATNDHVVGLADPGDLQLEFTTVPGSKYANARVAHAVHRSDLVLLRVPSLGPKHPPLPLSRTNDMKKGQKLIVLGHPGGSDELVVTQGNLASFREIRGARFLTLGATVNPGNSGGPTFRDTGALAGVVTLKSADEEGIGFAIPADVVLDALDFVKSAPAAEQEANVTTWQARQWAKKLVRGSQVSVEVLGKYLDAIQARGKKSEDEAVTEVRSRSLGQIALLDRLARDMAKLPPWLSAAGIADEQKALLRDLDQHFRKLVDPIKDPAVAREEDWKKAFGTVGNTVPLITRAKTSFDIEK